MKTLYKPRHATILLIGGLALGQALIGLTAAFGEPYTRLFTNRTMVLPPRGAQVDTLWATNTAYNPGTMVRIANTRRVYMALAPGGTSATSGSGPVGMGIVTNDGSVQWIYVQPKARRTWLIQHTSGGSADIFYETPGTNGAGWFINSAGQGFGEGGVPTEVSQAGIWVVTTGALLRIMED